MKARQKVAAVTHKLFPVRTDFNKHYDTETAASKPPKNVKNFIKHRGKGPHVKKSRLQVKTKAMQISRDHCSARQLLWYSNG
jgi:hypothetical protein